MFFFFLCSHPVIISLLETLINFNFFLIFMCWFHFGGSYQYWRMWNMVCRLQRLPFPLFCSDKVWCSYAHSLLWALKKFRISTMHVQHILSKVTSNDCIFCCLTRGKSSLSWTYQSVSWTQTNRPLHPPIRKVKLGYSLIYSR